MLLTHAGWSVQDAKFPDLFSHVGVAIREEQTGDGPADYQLIVDGYAVGILEAKRTGVTLSGVMHQAARYASGQKQRVTPRLSNRPLPFLYVSTGEETIFRNELDPAPRSRNLFAFHKPETLAKWLDDYEAGRGTLRQRLQQMPVAYPLVETGLWPPQIEAITNLERSLANNRPRALIQMATGSGKTFTAVNSAYRLIKYANAKHILFLVDRNNLGKQAKTEFNTFDTPDDGRKFTELYTVQRLTSKTIDTNARVVISTTQRLYASLRDTEIETQEEEVSAYELEEQGKLNTARPKQVAYQSHLPIELFDVIIIDECHRSIYNLWRQVLDYFDAYLIGLTATPTKQTIGFFNENLVMEYTHKRAVADGINVNGDVYRITTKVGEDGSTVQAGYTVGERDRCKGPIADRLLNEDFTYSATQLGRDVISPSRIRLVISTFRDDVRTKIFAGREHVPKTLIFAKDDNHAEEIVNIVRHVFDEGDAFCQKVTYRSKKKPDLILREARQKHNPRILVTVDMIATGTDIKPLECLIFLRDVKSLGYFEQMRGRGVRVINDSDLAMVTADAGTKDRFVIVDAVGVTLREKKDTTKSLNRQPYKALSELLQELARTRHPSEDQLSTLAARLARLQRKVQSDDALTITADSALGQIVGAASGRDSLQRLTHKALDLLDLPDEIDAADAQTQTTAFVRALHPLFAELTEISKRTIVTYDFTTQDQLRVAEYDADATERARQTIESFQTYIEANKDEITALRLIYSRPYSTQPLTLAMIKELAAQLRLPPHNWTTPKLWQAYQQLERDVVRGAPAERRLSDLVALLRYVVLPDDDVALLTPFPAQVQQRYTDWLAQQAAAGQQFSDTQRWWLDRIAEYIGVNLAMMPRDFDTGDFRDRGGRFAAMKELGGDWLKLLNEMNRTLATA
ncbi:MAG: DEAD/DEAH box helicase family protein [Candidatus Promineifilaceae bacterium]